MLNRLFGGVDRRIPYEERSKRFYRSGQVLIPGTSQALLCIVKSYSHTGKVPPRALEGKMQALIQERLQGLLTVYQNDARNNKFTMAHAREMNTIITSGRYDKAAAEVVWDSYEEATPEVLTEGVIDQRAGPGHVMATALTGERPVTSLGDESRDDL